MKSPVVLLFAGPNGSGKSTITSFMQQHVAGLYINADEIKKQRSCSDLLKLNVRYADAFLYQHDPEPHILLQQECIKIRSQGAAAELIRPPRNCPAIKKVVDFPLFCYNGKLER